MRAHPSRVGVGNRERGTGSDASSKSLNTGNKKDSCASGSTTVCIVGLPVDHQHNIRSTALQWYVSTLSFAPPAKTLLPP